jgi:hypothetical protein
MVWSLLYGLTRNTLGVMLLLSGGSAFAAGSGPGTCLTNDLGVDLGCDHGRVVEVTLDDAADSWAVVKLQAEAWELNIWAPMADLVRLRDIGDADWDARRTFAIGTCADAPVFWAMSEGQATILIGHDDETWDVAVTIPLATVHEIASLAEQRV